MFAHAAAAAVGERVVDGIVSRHRTTLDIRPERASGESPPERGRNVTSDGDGTS